MKFKLLVIVSAGLLVASSVFAAEFMTSQDGNIATDSTQTHHNLYTAGRNISINGPTTGDLVIAGKEIHISNIVSGNVDTAGNKIDVTANVGNSVRAAGQDITIAGSVAGDVLAAGSNVTINGAVKGDVLVAAKHLTFGSNAKVTGKINYYGSSNPTVADGAQIGPINHQAPKAHDFKDVARVLHGIGSIISIITWLLASLLLVWIFPRKATTVVTLMPNKIWTNIGLGLLALILTPIVIVLLFITLIGYYVAAVLLLSWLLLLCMSALLGAVWVGAWLVGLYKKSGLKAGFLEAIVGVLAFKLVGAIPILGFIFVMVVFLIALGATIRAGYARVKA